MAIQTISLEKLISHLKDALSAFPQLSVAFTSPIHLSKTQVSFSIGKNLEVEQTAAPVAWSEPNFNDLAIHVGQFNYSERELFSTAISDANQLVLALEKMMPFEGTLTAVHAAQPAMNQLLNPEQPLKVAQPLTFQIVTNTWRQTKLASSWMEYRDQLKAIQTTLAAYGTVVDCGVGQGSLEKRYATLVQNLLLKRSVSPAIDALPIYLFNAKGKLDIFATSETVNTKIAEVYPEFAKLPLDASIIENPSTLCFSGKDHPRVLIFPHASIELAIQKYHKLGEEIASLLKEPVAETTAPSNDDSDTTATEPSPSASITFNAKNTIVTSSGITPLNPSAFVICDDRIPCIVTQTGTTGLVYSNYRYSN
uniref:Uncharacterized protein n=1 Tax=Clandestinovirus TaxID=2831644 RepID=A0A8F8PN20_9VIRU|nr:hypothetical protein KOM_12_127 [Clandestinovirus]